MNHRQRVFDALAQHRGSYFSPIEVTHMTGLGVESCRDLLKRLYYAGSCVRKRSDKARDGRCFVYALTDTAQRPIDGRTTEGRSLVGR